MALRVTLVFPGISSGGFGSLGKGMDGGWISHGLASISAAAGAYGFDLNLIDLRALAGWEHFKAILAGRNPQVVGFTLMSVDGRAVLTASQIVKEVNPQIITMAGGPHVSLALEDARRFPNLDYLVTGEGESTFPLILKGISDGSPPSDRVILGERPALDTIPFCDREIFLEEWRHHGYALDSPEVPFVEELPPPFATLVAGRGCPYQCSFCKPGVDLLFGRDARMRSVGDVIRELQRLTTQYRLASFLFHDDCLLAHPAWLMEFARQYGEQGFTQPFFCQARADLIVKNRALIEELAGIGLRGLLIGFESGNQRILDFLRKGTTVEQNLDAAYICKRAGIAIWANYIIGIPTETREEVMDTVRMIRRIDPEYGSPAFFTPHPGTHLHDYVIEHDLSLWTDYDSYRRNPTEPKIKGQDYLFLNWAMKQSQGRKSLSRFKRWVKRQRKRLKATNVKRRLIPE